MYIMPVHHHIIYRIIYIYIYIINIIIPYISIYRLFTIIYKYIYILHIQVNLPPYFGQVTRPKPQKEAQDPLVLDAVAKDPVTYGCPGSSNRIVDGENWGDHQVTWLVIVNISTIASGYD